MERWLANIITWLGQNWPGITMLIGTVGSIVVIYKNVLDIKKKRLEIRKLLSDFEPYDTPINSIYIPTLKEIEEYTKEAGKGDPPPKEGSGSSPGGGGGLRGKSRLEKESTATEEKEEILEDYKKEHIRVTSSEEDDFWPESASDIEFKLRKPYTHLLLPILLSGILLTQILMPQIITKNWQIVLVGTALIILIALSNYIRRYFKTLLNILNGEFPT